MEAVHVVTMQALSGAGYPGVASLDIIDNVVPAIDMGGEDRKIETEPLKILGKWRRRQVRTMRHPHQRDDASRECARWPS